MEQGVEQQQGDEEESQLQKIGPEKIWGNELQDDFEEESVGCSTETVAGKTDGDEDGDENLVKFGID